MNSKFNLAVLLIASSVIGINATGQEGFVVLYDLVSKDGRKIEAVVKSVDSTSATIIRDSDRKEFTVSLSRFDRETVKLLIDIREDAKLNRDLYPYSKLEIRNRLRAIRFNANEQKEYSSEQRRALERLNSYRFFCGIPSNLVLDSELVRSSTNAATACEKNGRISHALNEDARVNNLGSASRKPPLSEFIDGWVNDGGKISNRRTRGHRLEMFSAEATKLGIAKSGKFAAMCVSPRDYYRSDLKLPKYFTFPGRGYYPASMINLMRNTGWSVLFDWQRVLRETGVPVEDLRKAENKFPSSKDIVVQVFKLSKKLEQRPEKGMPPPNSTEIEIKMLSSGRGHKTEYINFEPQMEAKPGAKYWVIVRCSHFEADYLVHFY